MKRLLPRVIASNTSVMLRNKYCLLFNPCLGLAKTTNRSPINSVINETMKTNQLRTMILPFFSSSSTSNHHHQHNGIKYVEQRIIGYKPEQVYKVVSNVNEYKNFLPNVKDSAFLNTPIVESPPDKDGLVERKTEAYLTVGFPPFLETYTSTVQLKEPISVKASSCNMKLFNRLVNHWTIAEGPSENTCRLTFHVDFEFSSKWYQSVANMFFDFCKCTLA